LDLDETLIHSCSVKEGPTTKLSILGDNGKESSVINF